MVYTYIGNVDDEVKEVIEYFDGEPITITLLDVCFEVSISCYSEEYETRLAARDSNLAFALLTLHKKMKEHKQTNS